MSRFQIFHSEKMLTRGNLKLYGGNDTVTTAHSEQVPHTYSYFYCCHVAPQLGICAIPTESSKKHGDLLALGGTGRSSPTAHLLAFFSLSLQVLQPMRLPLPGIFSRYLVCFSFSLPTPHTFFYTVLCYLILPSFVFIPFSTRL